jgi:subtilase family serine protease
LLGTYYLLVCADDLNAVTETNETNNCRASATTVQVTRPDLVVTVVGNPTSPVAAGGTLKVTDTVKNQGTAAAGAFTVRYYLSADQQKDATTLLAEPIASSLSATNLERQRHHDCHRPRPRARTTC